MQRLFLVLASVLLAGSLAAQQSTSEGSVVTVTDNYTCSPNNRLLLVPSTSSPIVVTLPPATASGQTITIVVMPFTGDGFPDVSVDPGGDDQLVDPSFNGRHTVCGSSGGALTVVSNGTGNWYVTSDINMDCNGIGAAHHAGGLPSAPGNIISGDGRTLNPPVNQSGSIATVSGDYTVVPDNRILLVDASSTQCNITLPRASATGQVIQILVVSSGFDVSVSGTDPDFIQTMGSMWVCNTGRDGQTLTLMSDGLGLSEATGHWYVLAQQGFDCFGGGQQGGAPKKDGGVGPLSAVRSTGGTTTTARIGGGPHRTQDAGTAGSVVTVTAAMSTYQAVSTNRLLLVDPTDGNVAITLPDASAVGQMIGIVVTADNNFCDVNTIEVSYSVIDPANFHTSMGRGRTVWFVSDGAGTWYATLGFYGGAVAPKRSDPDVTK